MEANEDSHGDDNVPFNQQSSLFQAEDLDNQLEPLKIYNCMLCNYKTPRKGGLKAHYAMHSEVRPFACDLCSYTAKRKYDLKKHKIIKHNKRYSKLKRFVSNHSSQLAQHQQQFSGGPAHGGLSCHRLALRDRGVAGSQDNAHGMMVKTEPVEYQKVITNSSENVSDGHCSQQSRVHSDECEEFDSNEASSHCTSTTHDTSYLKIQSQSVESATSSNPGELYVQQSSEGQENFSQTDDPNVTLSMAGDTEGATHRVAETMRMYPAHSPYLYNNATGEQSSITTHYGVANSTFSQPPDAAETNSLNAKISYNSATNSHSLYVEDQDYLCQGHGQNENEAERRDETEDDDTVYIDESMDEQGAEDLRKIPQSNCQYNRTEQLNNMPVNLSFHKERVKTQLLENVVHEDCMKSSDTMTKRMFCCEHCDILFADSALYLMHIGLHSADDPWKCKLCDGTFHDVYSFTSHFLNQHK